MTSWFRRYLLPGFVFQSMIIAGGYGTGRELVEFFLQYGPLGGLLGLVIPATLIASATSVVAFELARVTRTYDYRTFLQHLLGRAWFVYELGFLTAVLLILAVIGSAAGTFLAETFAIPGVVGTVGLSLAIGFLVFKGTKTIEGVLSLWSFVLYAVYISFFVLCLIRFGPEIGANLRGGVIKDGWLLSGTRYGALQVSLLPAMLFATTYIARRKEAVIAGVLAGPIALIPAILLYVAMLGHYPAILDRPLPANYLLELLESRAFQLLFQVVLLGTLIETGSGLIHAFNERIAGVYAAKDRSMPNGLRPVVAIVLLLCGLLLSRFGLVDLIAKGYGALTWVFIAILVLPLFTVGIMKILQTDRAKMAG